MIKWDFIKRRSWCRETHNVLKWQTLKKKMQKKKNLLENIHIEPTEMFPVF